MNDFNYNITLYNDKILNITNGGGAGTTGQVLSSTGNGIQWITPASGYNNITEDNSGNITIGPSSPALTPTLHFNGSTYVENAIYFRENTYFIIKKDAGGQYFHDYGKVLMGDSTTKVVWDYPFGIEPTKLSYSNLGNLTTNTINFSENIRLNNSKRLYITNGGDAGTSGQVLSSTGSGIQWITPTVPTTFDYISEDGSGNVTLGPSTPSTIPQINLNGNVYVEKSIHFREDSGMAIIKNAGGSYYHTNGMALMGNSSNKLVWAYPFSIHPSYLSYSSNSSSIEFFTNVSLSYNKKIIILGGGDGGTSGQVLTSTGTGIQWSSIPTPVVNDFNYNLTFYNNKTLTITNGGDAGTSGQILTSTGTGIEWTSPSGGGISSSETSVPTAQGEPIGYYSQLGNPYNSFIEFVPPSGQTTYPTTRSSNSDMADLTYLSHSNSWTGAIGTYMVTNTTMNYHTSKKYNEDLNCLYLNAPNNKILFGVHKFDLLDIELNSGGGYNASTPTSGYGGYWYFAKFAPGITYQLPNETHTNWGTPYNVKVHQHGQTGNSQLKIGFTSTSQCITINLGGVSVPSDDRVKINEEIITDATTTLLKLRPQNYDKKLFIEAEDGHSARESGLIAQEIYYLAPELRHIVNIPNDAEIDDNIPENIDDILNDPDYSKWGSDLAGVKYTQLIPYLIKGFQEHNTEINNLKNKNTELENKNTELQNTVNELSSIIDKLKNSNSFDDFKTKI